MKNIENKEFSQKFNYLRLRSGFETLAQFGEALAREGYIYEDSIFSRWKHGDRIPRARKVMIAIVKVFWKNGGLSTFTEANNFLRSAGMSDLKEEEIKSFSQLLNDDTKFISEINQIYNIQAPTYTEEEAFYISERILGSPFVVEHRLKLKHIFEEAEYNPRIILYIAKYIEINFEKINVVKQYIKDWKEYKYNNKLPSDVPHIKESHMSYGRSRLDQAFYQVIIKKFETVRKYDLKFINYS